MTTDLFHFREIGLFAERQIKNPHKFALLRVIRVSRSYISSLSHSKKIAHSLIKFYHIKKVGNVFATLKVLEHNEPQNSLPSHFETTKSKSICSYRFYKKNRVALRCYLLFPKAGFNSEFSKLTKRLSQSSSSTNQELCVKSARSRSIVS